MTTYIIKLTYSFVISAGALAICFCLAASGKAQCGTSPRQNISAFNAATTTKLPVAALTKLQSGETALQTDDQTLVGLWDVRYMIGTQLYDEVFDQFHSDGNEVAIDIVPPVSGNVCLGIWNKTQSRAFSVKHPFWVFDPATNTTLMGRGLISLRINLNRRGDSFTGTFRIIFRDLNGNPLPGFDDATGTLIGDRIENN